MVETKILFQSERLICVIFLAIAIYCNSGLSAQAQSVMSEKTSVNDRQIYSFRPPDLPDNGAPIGRRRGGTSRNDCPAFNTPLTALVPGKENSEALLASTVFEQPTFWVYIPYTPKNVLFGEFILQNDAGADIYRTSLKLTQTDAVIGISVPSNPKYFLKISQKYHWYFKLYCQEADSEAGYFYVDAWIQRVTLTPELQMKLKQNKYPEYTVYIDHNIWYDALTSLGKLVSANPQNNNIKMNWVKLLSSVGLQDIAQKPLVLFTE
ncbi:DUF928 domain-containing protein [Cylindrospermum sp. FACHB-282]|uniref:DUF928 domain-containing protein n=1 Tax=Cylindrospermum sp. FACHB-282 TaxID=2692794 RepID=UPI0016829683|nr:DUF928 domain-containing protein [Cylindrospermum sp. FACHB-282]MBD2387103.1 DUF928 domain-containing protein [Cylindrospermum sp. FACHB-282]